MSVRRNPALARWRARDVSRMAGGRLSAFWRDLLARDPMMQDVVLVIEVVFGGSLGGYSLRVSTDALDSVSGVSGEDHGAVPGLIEQPEVQSEYTVGEGTSSARSFSLTLSGQVIDPATIIANGGILGGFAEVCLEPRIGADYDRRLVLMRGDVGGGVAFGVGGKPEAEVMQFEIVDPRATIGVRIPPWVISKKRFASAHDSSIGERIPLVVNGYTVPAQRVTNNATGAQTFVFAWGRGWTVSTSAGVMVNGVIKTSADAAYGWSLVNSIDLKGEPYSAINFTNAATVWADSDVVHVVCTAATTKTVVETLRHIIENYTPLGEGGGNQSLWTEAAGKFNSEESPSVLINAGSGGASATAIEWAESGFLDSFPMISMVWLGGGYGPVVTDMRSDPVADWVADEWPLFDRSSMVQEKPKEELFNSFVIRYQYDPVLDVYAGVQTIGPSNSAICAMSRDLIGERQQADPIESIYINDDSLASYVIDWLAVHFALPSYYVEFIASPSVFVTRRIGDTISFTDSTFGWAKAPATIERLVLERGRATIGLRVWARYVDLGGYAFSQ